ncbi:MAG: glycerol kinase GlpK [bacterium]|nr:glycerol kinase GlpK [bacterium]
MRNYVLAIDQGTTSSRAILFDQNLQIAATAQQEFKQIFPRSGWVEHDPEEIWDSVLSTCREVMKSQNVQAKQINSIGITNQRETVVLWDKQSGKCLHNALVWQDRRTGDLCAKLKAQGHEKLVSRKTGLLLDPYFSATKIAWLLDHVTGARQAAEEGRVAFGTIDSFLLWRLSGGREHATDATNASRTLLYDICKGGWSDELCELFNTPASLLPQVKDCAADFGVCEPELFGAEIPINGIAGDQQAATIGQACFAPGMVKSTYGTGCFAMLNTGGTPVHSNNRLLTTIAYQLGGTPTYALEGSIFIAGAAVQWLRDGLGVIEKADETGELAAKADPHQSVYLVPAFVGLGAPHWDADARGAIYGLTRNTGPAELARAALESVCYQTKDLLDAMQADWPDMDQTILRVDGGMAASYWTMQTLADILDMPVDRASITETTALGVAYLAGMYTGFYPPIDEFKQSWSFDRRFEPSIEAGERIQKISGWNNAIKRTLTN